MRSGESRECTREEVGAAQPTALALTLQKLTRCASHVRYSRGERPRGMAMLRSAAVGWPGRPGGAEEGARV